MTDIDIIKNKFNARNQWALVIGDLMLDRYLIGNVSRISPEAPVPVVRLKESFERIGGSGNVAANLSLLGIKTILAGQIGNDIDGKKLLEMLKKIILASMVSLKTKILRQQRRALLANINK